MASQRRQKVLVLHHLGGNSIAMEKRMKTMVDQLTATGRFELHFLDGPYVLPDLASMPLNGKDTISLLKGDQVPDTHAETTLKRAIQTANLQRALADEMESEHIRVYKRARPNFNYSIDCLKALDDSLAAYPEVVQAAYDVLDAPCPSIKQMRSWLIHADGGVQGGWIGHERGMRVISDCMHKYGPFDGLVGFSSGAMLGQYAQAFLSGALSGADWEPLFNPPASQGPFKWTCLYSPFYPLKPRCQGYIKASNLHGSPTLIVGGEKDKISSPRDLQVFAKVTRANALWMHGGGHILPTHEEWPTKIAEWILAASRQDSFAHLVRVPRLIGDVAVVHRESARL